MKIVVFGATGNVGQRIVDPDAVQSPDPRVRLVKGDVSASRTKRGERKRFP